jgi:GGDEF domain-containing protein
VRGMIGRLFGFDKEIEDLKGRIRSLSWDDAFGMWTRCAFLHFCEVMPRGDRCVFLLDLDGIHGLNARLGYRAVDERIRKTFSIPFRASDIIARWYSGDEIVILFDGALEGALHKMRELEASAALRGLSFRWQHDTWHVGEESVKEVVDRMGVRLSGAKEPGRAATLPYPLDRLAAAGSRPGSGLTALAGDLGSRAR